MDKARKKIKTLIVDDEPLARQSLRVLLSEDSEIELIGECGSGAEALRAIGQQSPDLIFLDIQMPSMNGFDVLERLDAEHLPAIIFVTAFDQYAIKAFEVHALDYLLKPFSDARFWKALKQAKVQVEQREVSELSQRLIALLDDREHAGTDKTRATPYLSRLMIKSASRVLFLKVDEIDWIEAADYYVNLHVGRKTHLIRETMGELETKLDPQKFQRVHRSSIVNLDRVRELHPMFNGEYIVVLQDGTELKLSRSRREQLEQKLELGGY
jgi:two-component system LytT family response regulator